MEIFWKAIFTINRERYFKLFSIRSEIQIQFYNWRLSFFATTEDPKKPNWPVFIKKLIEEEYLIRKCVNRNENGGNQFTHSKSFNKPYVPENLQKKILEEQKTNENSQEKKGSVKIIDNYLLETGGKIIPIFC